MDWRKRLIIIGFCCAVYPQALETLASTVEKEAIPGESI